jgi:hypothetical protein
LSATCGATGVDFCSLAAAAPLQNGNILFAMSAGFQTAPTHFFEFTGAKTINQVGSSQAPEAAALNSMSCRKSGLP